MLKIDCEGECTDTFDKLLQTNDAYGSRCQSFWGDCKLSQHTFHADENTLSWELVNEIPGSLGDIT